jgi:hypothetical protein
VNFDTIIPVGGLVLSIVLTLYGVMGLQTGEVTGQSMAFYTKQTYTGKKASMLSIAWIVCGLLGTVAFGGHLAGFRPAAPLYNFFMDMLKSG